MFFSWVLEFIPFYYTLRLGFFVYLMAPQTNGAMMFYESIFSPLLKKHERKINNIINKVSVEANKVVSEVASPENIAKAAQVVEEAKEAVSADKKED